MSIVARSQQLIAQTKQINKATSDRDDAKNISETYERLRRLEQRLSTLAEQTAVLRAQVPLAFLPEFAQHLTTVRQKLSDAQHDFESKRRQVRAIDEAQSAVERAETVLKNLWVSYVSGQLEPIRIFLKLVQNLPEVQSYLAEQRDNIRLLTEFEKRLPRNLADWSKFNQALEQYKAVMNRVEGLDPEIQTFLQKVQNGRATLADLTPNILKWCREGNRLEAFSIQLGNL